MVEIGSIIRATVSRVEPYGVWMSHAAGPVLVLVPEASWSDHRPLSEWIRPGDEYDVFVLRYNYRDRVIVGSIRRLHPEENPYRQPARLEPGTILHGRVRLVAGDAVSVVLPNGAWGNVPRASFSTEIRPGDEIDVIITAIEVDEGRLSLATAAAAEHRHQDLMEFSR